MKNSLVALSLLFSFNALSASSATCFSDKLPFLKNYGNYKTSLTRKVLAIETACREISSDEMMSKQGGLEFVKNKFIGVLSFGLIGGAAAAFSDLSNTADGRKYMSTLNEIKKIPNPMERIKKTYELAASHSGHYDEETNGIDTWKSGILLGAHRPENLLANNRDRGTVGVCREFAALLQWSLMQVSRHSASRSTALGKYDFSSNVIGGTVLGGGHAWVRVNMPVFRNGRLIDFTHFDLDTTWYPEKFAPLFPRRSGLSKANQKKLVQQCEEVIDCLWRI